MDESIYEFSQMDEENPTVFSFTSKGLKDIKKIVSFERVPGLGLQVDNLVLADEMQDGFLDAEIDSNNGDILKVLNTTAAILEYYVSINKGRAIYIKGSDERRINVYHWRITRRLNNFAVRFKILGQMKVGGDFEELVKTKSYIGFLVIPQP